MPVVIHDRLYYRYTWDMNGMTCGWEQANSLRVVMDGFDHESCEMGPCDFVKPYQPHPNARPGEVGNDVNSPRPFFLHTDVVYLYYDNQSFDYWTDPAAFYAELDVNFDPYIWNVDYLEAAPYGWDLMLRQTTYGGQGYYRSGFFYFTQDTTYDPGNLPFDPDHIGEPGYNGPCADPTAPTGNPDTEECWPEWEPITWWQADELHVDGDAGNWYSNLTPLCPWCDDGVSFAERTSVNWVP
jgi:hypothetical protein